MSINLIRNNLRGIGKKYLNREMAMCDTYCRLIESSAKNTGILDPMPTSLVIGCTQVLINCFINLSLESGVFADNCKCALVNPLRKKPGLDLVFKNYRPVSNHQYVSKLTERAVFNQIHDHMVANCVYHMFESAFRLRHSTETALLAGDELVSGHITSST